MVGAVERRSLHVVEERPARADKRFEPSEVAFDDPGGYGIEVKAPGRADRASRCENVELGEHPA